MTIAHRKAIDILRAQQRRAVPVDEVPDRRAATGTEGLVGHADLWGAVKAFPVKQRQAVAYHYPAGLPYAEVASIIGGTAAAGRRAAADGISKLRTTYPDALPEGGTR